MKIQLPDTFDISHPERYIFTLEVHPAHFSFALYNPIENGSYFYQRLEKEKGLSALASFREFFFDNEFLSLPFRKIYIINFTSRFSYIPTLMFEEKDDTMYMEFLLGKSKQKSKLLNQSLPAMSMTIIHEMEEDTYEFIQRSFINPKYIHHSSPLISYFRDRVRLVNAGRMLVNLSTQGIDVLCFSREDFVLGNHFEFTQKEDAVYYILFTWKQLKFDQEKDFLYIAGNAEQTKDLMSEIKQYIHNLIPVNITPEAHFEGINTGDIPFELSSLTLCEL
ncbi:DUF3822 family protein [Bacteroidales bacterium OttesenSCG-928-I14]|nr:DUF3822 family protein [Bacteroidales bacterium OttesenSCG-928-I14]